jgi:membrane-associated phospholipid phosphatase
MRPLCPRRMPCHALASVAILGLTVAETPALADSASGGLEEDAADYRGWWTTRNLVHYGVIAAGAAGYLLGERVEPRDRALIGPVYDPSDISGVLASTTVNQPIRDETVPSLWLRGALATAGLSLVSLEAALWAQDSGSAQQFHDTVIGYAEAVALTGGTTSLVKAGFGRLRPDFGERARIYHCSVEPEAYQELCADFPDSLVLDREEAEHLLDDGRRSFISGHSSHAFNSFTYASLVLGSRFVWGPDSTAQTRAAGIAAQAAMMGTATFIAVSRDRDHRHHTSDVVTGSLVGFAVANLAYWVRFHPDGSLRRDVRGAGPSRLSVQPGPLGPGGLGVALSVSLD